MARVRGRPTVIPGAEVVSRYANGQASEYRVEGLVLSRRQYQVLVEKMQEDGKLPPRHHRRVADENESV